MILIFILVDLKLFLHMGVIFAFLCLIQLQFKVLFFTLVFTKVLILFCH